MKCDACGRFTRTLIPVWCNPRSGGIDREVCERCDPDPVHDVPTPPAEGGGIGCHAPCACVREDRPCDCRDERAVPTDTEET